MRVLALLCTVCFLQFAASANIASKHSEWSNLEETGGSTRGINPLACARRVYEAYQVLEKVIGDVYQLVMALQRKLSFCDMEESDERVACRKNAVSTFYKNLRSNLWESGILGRLYFIAEACFFE